MTTITDNLKAVRELLSVPERWTKKADARDDMGRVVFFDSDDAASWCLVGAVEHQCHRLRRPRFALLNALKRRGGIYPLMTLQEFNDAETTTHADVLALLDEAIAQEGAP